MTFSQTAKRIQLVADVGATHARFGLADDGRFTGVKTVLATTEYSDALSLSRTALDQLGGPDIHEACFAVAGPVTEGRATVTNGGLEFSGRELSRALGVPVRLVNDFHALAMAVPGLSNLQFVGGDPARAGWREVKAVLGPGSGLGMSALLPWGTEGWRVLASEGGHADLAPGNHLEQELLTVLLTRHEGVCWETVLSGPGLRNLYEAVSMMWGMPAQAFGPQEISRLGVDVEDPVCHQALELFFALLGAAAGNLALTVCAYGGVYIGGGIVPGLAEFARSSPLRRRFEERVELAELVADIPLCLIQDEDPGLSGAAACLAAGPADEVTR